MKRWITGCLALLLALTAAGCSGAASPEERFGAVVQQAAELSSMEVDADTRIRMALGQEVLDQTSETAAQLFRDGETVEMSVKSTVRYPGQEISGESYYRDGHFYTSVMGQSFQVPYDGNLVLEQLRVEFPQPPAASELSLLKMDREGNGTAFSYAVRPESLEQYVDQAILLIGSGLFPAEGMKVTAVSGRVTVGPDNRIQSHTMRMSVQIDLGGPVLEAAAERVFRYRNVGGLVSVEFPADLESYTPVG